MSEYKRKHHSLLTGALCSALLMTSACSSLQGDPLAQMTFSHVKPQPVYTASYEPVALLGGTTNLPPGFVADPAKITYDYLNNRFQAAGEQGKLKINILYSMVEYDTVSSQNKFGQMLGVDKKDHYVIKVGLGVQAFGVNGFEQKATKIKAQRDVYISEHVSLVEREKLQMEALDLLVDEIDGALQSVLRGEFKVMHWPQ